MQASRGMAHKPIIVQDSEAFRKFIFKLFELTFMRWSCVFIQFKSMSHNEPCSAGFVSTISAETYKSSKINISSYHNI